MRIKEASLALCLVAIFCTSSQSFSQHGSVHPISIRWYYANRMSGSEGFIAFRKYAIVSSIGIDGTMDFNDLRNVYIFNCSIDGVKPSYLTLVVPREISLPKITGSQYLEYFKLDVSIDGKVYAVVADEIEGNEVYIDFSNENIAAIGELVSAGKVEFRLAREFSISFFNFGDFDGKEILGYKSFDETVMGSITTQYGEVASYDGKEMLSYCGKFR